MMPRLQLASLTFAFVIAAAGCGSITLTPDGGGAAGSSSTGSAGTGGAGTTGAGGATGGSTGAGGAGGSTGAAGTTGGGGTTGAAGAGAAGTGGGTAGTGGGTAGTGGGTAGTGGTTGTAGSGGTAGAGGTTGSGGHGGGGAGGSGGTGGSGGSCGGVTCNIACMYGFATDPSTGCPICQCNPAPDCTDADCGTPPPTPICQSGKVNQATCTRGTDGTCAWHGPTCVPCPVLYCPLAAPICPVNQAQAQVAPTGCPGCGGCTPLPTQ